MKTLVLSTVLLLATTTLAQDRYSIHSIGDDVYLLNSSTGATCQLDRERLEWVVIKAPANTASVTTLPELTVSNIEVVDATTPGGPVDSSASIINRSPLPRRYNVAVSVPSGSTFVQLNVFHHDLEGSMSGETLPPPESVLAKDTVYFDLVAQAFERMEIKLVFATKQSVVSTTWRVRDDLGQVTEARTETITTSPDKPDVSHNGDNGT